MVASKNTKDEKWARFFWMLPEDEHFDLRRDALTAELDKLAKKRSVKLERVYFALRDLKWSDASTARAFRVRARSASEWLDHRAAVLTQLEKQLNNLERVYFRLDENAVLRDVVRQAMMEPPDDFFARAHRIGRTVAALRRRIAEGPHPPDKGQAAGRPPTGA